MPLLGARPAAALDPQRPLAEFTLTSWGREDGLPHSFIIDLAQSADGALTTEKYKTLIVIQPDFVEDAVLDKIDDIRYFWGNDLRFLEQF